MKLSQSPITKTCDEQEVFESTLSLDHQNILELGCGDASQARLIATTGEGRNILAAEVDAIQHEKNLQIDDLPNVDFVLSGAEAIPSGDSSIDTVFMFKSLHHVPLGDMDRALQEIYRVLKPGGMAYISEPIFAGDFNKVLRLFHDEERVRQAAFDALQRMVDSGRLQLKKELFFNTPVCFENFQQYSEKVINVSFKDHQISDELMEKIVWKFERMHTKNDGCFLIPIRVDLLQKPG